MQRIAFYLSLFCLFLTNIFSLEKPFIIGSLFGQLGNQLFQIATTLSLAKDNDAIALFPDLIEKTEENFPLNYKYVFNKLLTDSPAKERIEHFYVDPAFHYTPILYRPNMNLFGYFQSEKYFKKNKNLILETFAPSKEILDYLKNKYAFITSHTKTVSVHLRFYVGARKDAHPFVGRNYLKRALAQFDEDSLFVIFSDHLPLAKKALSKLLLNKNHVFIDGNKHFQDLYLMSLCKHNIIANSSFSWWGAYLNKNPEKIVIAPKKWFGPYYKDYNVKDVVPPEWVQL